MALDITVAGAAANSYCSVAEVDAYFAAHWSSAKQELWSALSSAQKELVLRAATAIIEQLRFSDTTQGVIFDTYLASPVMSQRERYQRLSFPRNVDITEAGVVFIPQEVKDALCEQAVYLLTHDDSSIATRMSGIVEEEVAAGSVRVRTRYEGASGGGASGAGSFIAPMAIELLRPFLRGGARRMLRA